MQNSYVFLLLCTLTLIQIISSLNMIDKEASNEHQQFSWLFHDSSLLKDLLSIEKQPNDPLCLSKSDFDNVLHRNLRASISRVYFRNWRRSHDNPRFLSKSLLVYSPRLGKRDVNQYEIFNNNKQFTQDKSPFNSDTGIIVIVGYPKEDRFNVIYENSTDICLLKTFDDILSPKIVDQLVHKPNNQ